MPKLQPSQGRTSTVVLSGGEVEIRELTAGEANHIKAIKDPDESNVQGIAYGTGDPIDHVRAWYAAATAADALTIVRAISRLSGLDEGAQFPDPTGDDAGPARPAE